MNVGSSEVAVPHMDIDSPSRATTIGWLFVHDLRATLDANRHPGKHGALRADYLDSHAGIVPRQDLDSPAPTHDHAAGSRGHALLPPTARGGASSGGGDSEEPETRWPAGEPVGQAASVTSSDLWDAETAAGYDQASEFMFAPAVLDPAVRFLADLAGDGAALEFAIGTGRVAIPLAERGLPVSGIELSQPMADQLHLKRDDIPVLVGDMATSTIPGSFSLVYVVWNSIGNLVPRPSRSPASATQPTTSPPAADSSSNGGRSG